MTKHELLQDGKLVAVAVSMLFCTAMSATCTTNAKAEPVKQEPQKVVYEVPVVIEATVVQNEAVHQKTVSIEQIEDDGFVAFDIPEDYAATGGDFPEDLQRFTKRTCEEQGVPYSLIVAMIEVESGYQADAISSCGAVGYMQIVEKWHHDRMAKYGLDCADDPQANILVGVDFMAELLSQYSEEEALVIYNCGSKVADSTPYSREIVRRKAELEKELDL